MNACEFRLFLFLFTLLVCHNMTSSADKGQHFALRSRKTTKFAARMAYKTDKFTGHSSVWLHVKITTERVSVIRLTQGRYLVLASE
jgi:hypothetical protein